MYLVDTNIVSEARRGRREAVDWLRSVDPAAFYLSVITLGEISRGAALKQKSDPVVADRLLAWLQILRTTYGARILPVTDSIAIAMGPACGAAAARRFGRARSRRRPSCMG